uniref:GAG-pre-integrase domain-containing protein n=1 Tax=Cannabis sativa TaxID=3483 RepID=A0A803P3H5_CANSA
MSSAKFKIDKFTRENEFCLWRLKMIAMLMHRDISEAIEPEGLEDIKEDKKKVKEIQKKSHEMKFFERFLKRLYTLRMDESAELRKHLDKFNKIILKFNNICVKIEEEDQGIVLLSSLPRCHEYFVDTMLSGKETLTMFEVKVALNSKETQKKFDDKSGSNWEGLMARGVATLAICFENGANRNKLTDQTRLWHQRFGHVIERGITELEKQGILKGEINTVEPTSYKEAINIRDGVKWLLAIQEETPSLIKNKTWLSLASIQFRQVNSSKLQSRQLS